MSAQARQKRGPAIYPSKRRGIKDESTISQGTGHLPQRELQAVLRGSAKWRNRSPPLRAKTKRKHGLLADAITDWEHDLRWVVDSHLCKQRTRPISDRQSRRLLQHHARQL